MFPISTLLSEIKFSWFSCYFYSLLLLLLIFLSLGFNFLFKNGYIFTIFLLIYDFYFSAFLLYYRETEEPDTDC
jgi:hypothetical protein